MVNVIPDVDNGIYADYTGNMLSIWTGVRKTDYLTDWLDGITGDV